MGRKPSTNSEAEIDICALSGARALKKAGYSEERIAQLFGYVPRLDMTLDEVLAHNAKVRTPLRATELDDEGSFQGDI